eukprot:6172945-Pleurochrysis_carterae.AAC.1
MSEAQHSIHHIDPEPEPAQQGGKKRKPVRTAITSGGASSTRPHPQPPPPSTSAPKPSAAKINIELMEDDEYVDFDADEAMAEAAAFIPLVGEESSATGEFEQVGSDATEACRWTRGAVSLLGSCLGGSY